MKILGPRCKCCTHKDASFNVCSLLPECFYSPARLRSAILDNKETQAIRELLSRRFHDAELVEVGEKHGWNGVENSKVLATFFDNELSKRSGPSVAEVLEGLINATETLRCVQQSDYDRGHNEALSGMARIIRSRIPAPAATVAPGEEKEGEVRSNKCKGCGTVDDEGNPCIGITPCSGFTAKPKPAIEPLHRPIQTLGPIWTVKSPEERERIVWEKINELVAAYNKQESK